MAKEDFGAGFLQGLYNAGIGNPDVRRERDKQNLATSYKQAELDAKQAEEGNVPVSGQDPFHSKIGDFVSRLFNVDAPKSLNTAYQADPNAKSLYLDNRGEPVVGDTSKAFRLSPKETKEFLVKKGTQPIYQQTGYDASGNYVGEKTFPRGVKPTSVIRPQPVKTGKPGSSVDATLELYETARKGLLDGLAGTNTGFFAGKLPEMTANQQVAQGAVAAMAPVLKALFRVAGEGVFTDRDQALLLDMIPTRDTDEAAIPIQMENIDKIVKAKLGLGGSQSNPDQEAIDWAKSNQNDPRAKEILKLHGL